MWDPSSPTRDQTHIPCPGSTVLNTGPLGKSLSAVFSNSLSPDAFMVPEETKSEAIFKHLIPTSTQISSHHTTATVHCPGCHIRTLDSSVTENLSSHGSENKMIYSLDVQTKRKTENKQSARVQSFQMSRHV